MLRIRPHHLNCIPRFEGRGYSEEFCANMKKIQQRIKNGEAYCLVSGADDVCAFCPNLINGVCTDEEKVSRYDRLTLQNKNSDIAEICADCKWYYICSEKSSKLQSDCLLNMRFQNKMQNYVK